MISDVALDEPTRATVIAQPMADLYKVVAFELEMINADLKHKYQSLSPFRWYGIEELKVRFGSTFAESSAKTRQEISFSLYSRESLIAMSIFEVRIANDSRYVAVTDLPYRTIQSTVALNILNSTSLSYECPSIYSNASEVPHCK